MISKIIDCTLREGQQASGVYFSRSERRTIIAALGAFGVDEIEIGPAAPDSGMAEIVQDIRLLAPKSRAAVWCRCLERDIELALLDGSDTISISLPVSDLHLEKRLNKNRRWAMDQVAKASEIVRTSGQKRYLSLGLEDASRADQGFLRDVVRQAEAHGFDRVRLADTVGALTPLSVRELFMSIREVSAISLAIHTHNDFGMATANAITALDSGAEWIDASVLGLGERAGIARLEEVGGYLSIRQGRDDYDVKVLAPLIHFTAGITNTAVSVRHPIVGEKIFHCESGIHLDGLSKSEEMYQAFSPSVLGQQWTKSIGMKSGLSAVRATIESMKVSCKPSTVQDITNRIRSMSRELGRALSEGELLNLVSDARRASVAEAG